MMEGPLQLHSPDHGKSGGRAKHRQKNIKLLLHPPSIPTKFQSFYFDDHEPKAFCSTSPRFSQRTDELPGPGYYEKDRASRTVLAVQCQESFSRHGFGIGFVSKARRFFKTETTRVGPGAYNIAHEPKYSDSLTHSPTSAFREPIALSDDSNAKPAVPGQTIPSRRGKPFPGPGQYDTERAMERVKKSRLQENGAHFVFKSKSKRSEINDPEATPGRFAPPPGAYEVREVQTHKASGIAAFKAKARAPLVDPKSIATPGPATYELIHPDQHRLCYGRDRMHVASVVPTKVIETIRQEVPGPGWYNLMERELPHLKSAKLSAFVSKSSRFAPIDSTRPGPGFYHPLPEYKSRSFHLNSDQKWTQ
ncbi:hypothetical protein BJ742DRAFT_202960 [Cladochytrium replicatum]|nr:hypothetical protein BJ742DRAFT_202960 [Cladochytrium replicatum]